MKKSAFNYSVICNMHMFSGKRESLLTINIIRRVTYGLMLFIAIMSFSSCGRYDNESESEGNVDIATFTTTAIEKSGENSTVTTVHRNSESTTYSVTVTTTTDKKVETTVTIPEMHEDNISNEFSLSTSVPSTHNNQPVSETVQVTVTDPIKQGSEDIPKPAHTTTTVTNPPPTTPDPVVDDSQVDISFDENRTGYDYDKAYEIAQLINNLRVSVGKSEMTYNDSLVSAAMLRAEELSVLNSHDRPNGMPGISAIWEYTNESWYENENIASCGAIASAEFMYNLWYTSPGHYGTMTDSAYDRCGVGIYYKNGYTYAVLLVAGDDK